MIIDVYKSCRKLWKQAFSAELNIRNTNTKYSSMILTVAVAERLIAYFPLIKDKKNIYFHFYSYIPDSSRVGRNFVFQKTDHWNVPATRSTE